MPVEDCVREIHSYSSPDQLDAQSDAAALVDKLRWAADDLKAYYAAPVTAQPGGASQRDIEGWFWSQTTAGSLIKTLRTACQESETSAITNLGRFMLVLPEHA